MDEGNAPGRPWRTAAGLVLAILLVVLLSPSERAPWSALVHRLGAGLTAPALASILLLVAAALMPRPGSEPPRRRDGVALAVGMLLVLEPVMHLTALWWSAQVPTATASEVIFPEVGAHRASWYQWAMWGEVLVLAPMAEEWFFRGRLLPWLNQRLGRVSGVSITTLAFAVAHLQPTQALLALPLGLLLAWLRLRGGGVAGCIVAHGAHNLLFLVLGPALIGQTTMAPVLVVGGLVIVALAWLHLSGPMSYWRPLTAAALVVAGATLAAVAQPWHRTVVDRWWVGAAHLQVVYWRIDNDELLARIDNRLRTGLLHQVRREALADRLRTSPCQTMTRQRLILGTLDPVGFANRVEEQDADSVLEDFACSRGGGERDLAVLALAQRYPGAFSRVVANEPPLLGRWLPIPGAVGQGAAQLAATTDPLQHRALLSAWERACPGRVAEVLVRLPAQAVTMNDRRHLWTRYADAPQRLEALRATDPERAAAFGPGWGGEPRSEDAGALTSPAR